MPYQVDNSVLKEEFRVQVDDICAARELEMDKSLFKGLFLPVSHRDVSKVAMLGLNLHDDTVLSSVVPVDMSVV